MKTENIIKPFLKKEHLEILPGDTVKVSQKIKEGDKERVQIFQGVVIARKHGKEIGATITVRRVISGVGVERIFPLHSPIIEKIEIIKRSKVRRGKLYYLRKAKGKKARLKRRKFIRAVVEEKPAEKKAPEEKPKKEIKEPPQENQKDETKKKAEN